MKKRRILILALISLMILVNVSYAGAASNPEPGEMAVYLSGKFYGNSAYVDGSIYTANGDVEFSNASSNDVTGNIYHKLGRSFILPQYYNPSFAQRVYPLENTHFDGAYPGLIDPPDIDNFISSFKPQWDTPALTITEDTHFGELDINSTNGPNPLIVDTGQGDIYIKVDKLSFGWNKSIKLIGSGRLFLFVNELGGSAPIEIDNGGDAGKLYIFTKAPFPSSSMNIHGHVYFIGFSGKDLSFKGTITGGVITDAATLTITGGQNVVNGLVFAPMAKVDVRSSGESSPGVYIPGITGRLVAKELNLTNNGRIVYEPTFAYIEDNLIPEVQKHEVRVTANNPAWGSVSPSSVTKNYGETVNVTATPNAGYKFLGFTSANGSALPDINGNITVTGPILLTANFAPDIPVVGYANGLLGEYYDSMEPLNPSALKVRRIDSSIAFNFGYDLSPDPVIGHENFSVRWTGYIKPDLTGDYTFKTLSDDGIKLYIDGQKLLDNWGLFTLDYQIADHTIHLEAGQYYPITMEYQQGPLYSAAFLFWESNNGVPMSLVPGSVLYVEEETKDEYMPAKYYNALQKSGSGFTNTFWDNNGANEFSEINNIDYSWGFGAPGDIKTDAFSGIMEGYLEAKFTEATTLVFTVDDAIRVWIDDTLVIDEWDWHSHNTFEYTFNTIAGEKYKVKVEYAEFGIGASIVMGWRGAALGSETIPKAYMYTIP